MFTEKQKDVLKLAISHYGDKHQKLKALEELTELQTALLKDLNNLEHNIYEEIADCYIMLEQLEYIHCCKVDVQEFIDLKINRLKERIECDNHTGGLE